MFDPNDYVPDWIDTHPSDREEVEVEDLYDEEDDWISERIGERLEKEQ